MFLIQAITVWLVVAIAIGCVLLWNQAFAAWSAGRELVPFERRRPVPWSLGAVLLIVLGVFAVNVLVVQAIRVYSEQDSTPPSAVAGDDGEKPPLPVEDKFRLIVASALTSLVALGAAAWCLSYRGASPSDLGLDFRCLARDCKLGLGGFLLISIPMFTLQAALSYLIPPRHDVSDIFAAQPGMLMLLITGTAAVVIAPVAEEFFFRVILQGWLEAMYTRRRAVYVVDNDTARFERPPAALPETDILGDRAASADAGAPALTAGTAADSPGPSDRNDTPETANPGAMPVLLSSFLFAAVHVGNGPSPLPLFLFALVLGYLYRQTHRLLPCVVAHASLNALSTLLMVVAGG